MENHNSRVTRGQVRHFREQQGWSQTQLGSELANGLPRGYSRSYIRNIEAGTMPVSRFFVARFNILRARIRGEQVNAKQILMRGRFPKRLIISAKPKRCDVCGWPFIGSTPTQKRCGPKCARIARQRMR